MHDMYTYRGLVAPRIQDFRMAMGLNTQAELGRFIGATQATVSRWENPELDSSDLRVVEPKFLWVAQCLGGSLKKLNAQYREATERNSRSKWVGGEMIPGALVFREIELCSPLWRERHRAVEWVEQLFDDKLSQEEWENLKRTSLAFSSLNPLAPSRMIADLEDIKEHWPGIPEENIIFPQPSQEAIQADLETHGASYVANFLSLLAQESKQKNARFGDSEGPAYSLLRGTLLEMLKAHPEIRQLRTSDGPANLEELSFSAEDFPKMKFEDWLPEEWEEAPLPCLAAMDFFTLALALSIDESGAMRKSSLEVLKKSAANWSRLRRENEDWKPTGNPGRRFMDLWEGLEAASNG